MWEDLQITNRLLYQLSYVGFQQLTYFVYPICIPFAENRIGTSTGLPHRKNITARPGAVMDFPDDFPDVLMKSPGYNHPVMGTQIATLREDLATRVASSDKWAQTGWSNGH